jgi:hypothetical protein
VVELILFDRQARANGDAEDASVAVPVQLDAQSSTEAVGDAVVDEAPAGAVQEAGAGGVQLDQTTAASKPLIDLVQLEKRVVGILSGVTLRLTNLNPAASAQVPAYDIQAGKGI